MGRKVAIVKTHAHQMLLKKQKMLGLFFGNLNPVFVKISGHALKAPHHIQSQIDGIEFNVGNGMKQDGPAFGGGQRF